MSPEVLPITKKPQPTEAWVTLSRLLPARDADSDYWWGLTGSQLSFMLDAAGYPMEKQYEALLFHYHWATPNMGQAPSANELKWRSLITVEGGPIEYSWKWPTTNGEPDIRYSLEPINRFSGSPEDPLNQAPASQMLNRLAATVPGVDLTWTNHFLATLFDHDKTKFLKAYEAAGVGPSSTFGIAAEFVPKGLGFKAYFVPRKLEPTPERPFGVWEDSFKQLHPENPSRDVLMNYLTNTPEGKRMTPLLCAVDCVDPAKSRLKWYFQSPSSSFATVRDIVTLHGVRSDLDTQLAGLRELMYNVLGLPGDFPDEEEAPLAAKYNPKNKENDNFEALPGLLTGFIYYFDIPPRASVPEVKLYIPVWRYGRDDLSIAKATAKWVEARGRGAYGQQFLNMLQNVASHRDLSAGLGLQSYVSCVLRKGNEPDITTYMSAELLHPLRLAQEAAK
ncbi:dimethylallyl tryptophan synthase GliD1 [Jackrogersella minutella]|nr:dimethylallyl tryptophan synthase GliD1 [Jackrogersella minutella]